MRQYRRALRDPLIVALAKAGVSAPWLGLAFRLSPEAVHRVVRRAEAQARAAAESTREEIP